MSTQTAGNVHCAFCFDVIQEVPLKGLEDSSDSLVNFLLEFYNLPSEEEFYSKFFRTAYFCRPCFENLADLAMDVRKIKEIQMKVAKGKETLEKNLKRGFQKSMESGERMISDKFFQGRCLLVQ